MGGVAETFIERLCDHTEVSRFGVYSNCLPGVTRPLVCTVREDTVYSVHSLAKSADVYVAVESGCSCRMDGVCEKGMVSLHSCGWSATIYATRMKTSLYQKHKPPSRLHQKTLYAPSGSCGSMDLQPCSLQYYPMNISQG